MTLLSVLDIGCHRGTPCVTPQDHVYTHARSCAVTGGLVGHYELLPSGQTITANLYSQYLERVEQALKQKEPVLVNRLELEISIKISHNSTGGGPL